MCLKMFQLCFYSSNFNIYNQPAMMEELYTGYLLKSPPLTALTKNIVRLISQFNL